MWLDDLSEFIFRIPFIVAFQVINFFTKKRTYKEGNKIIIKYNVETETYFGKTFPFLIPSKYGFRELPKFIKYKIPKNVERITKNGILVFDEPANYLYSATRYYLYPMQVRPAKVKSWKKHLEDKNGF